MSTTIQHISSFVDRWAPERTQMDFDNVGLLVGDPQARVDKIITCLDVTPEVVNEAINGDADLIVAHHPLIFNKLETVTPTDDHGWMIYNLIQNDIGVLAAHTNLDAARGGVSELLAEKIGLTDIDFLDASYRNRYKVVFNTLAEHRGQAEDLLQKHRADQIQILKPENQDASQLRFEALVEDHKLGSLKSALRREELLTSGTIETWKADNATPHTGMGAIGKYDKKLSEEDFLQLVSDRLNVEAIRYSGSADEIGRVAVCGGAGVFLASKAIGAGADAFVTSDIKYHDYFTEQDQFILADIGHYESEIPIAEKLAKILSDEFKELEVSTTGVSTNPMKIFTPNKET